MLFDRILSLARSCRSNNELAQAAAEYLPKCEIFKIDNLPRLSENPRDDCRMPIPKRPPYEHTWVEWGVEVYDDLGKMLVRAVCGVLVRQIPRGIFLDGPEAYNFSEMLHGGDELLSFLCFADVRKSNIASAPHGVCYDGISFVSLKDDSRELVKFTCASNPLKSDGQPPWLPCAAVPASEGRFVPIAYPPCVLYAFQLLSCKNIVTEVVRPPERLNKAMVRRGQLPHYSYKTLKVVLPGLVGDAVGGDGSEKHNRLHMVRGHFKNLKHDRYRQKGWHWWPAHLRGSAELGYVDKDYDLVARGDET